MSCCGQQIVCEYNRTLYYKAEIDYHFELRLSENRESQRKLMKA